MWKNPKQGEEPINCHFTCLCAPLCRACCCPLNTSTPCLFHQTHTIKPSRLFSRVSFQAHNNSTPREVLRSHTAHRGRCRPPSHTTGRPNKNDTEEGEGAKCYPRLGTAEGGGGGALHLGTTRSTSLYTVYPAQNATQKGTEGP